MTIIEDTRQQAGKHTHKAKYFEEAEIKVIRSKLPYGDYAVLPAVSVDTKKDIYELASNLNQEHKRFKAECVGAKENGCRLIILVENEDGIFSLSSLVDWSEPAEHFEMRKKLSKNPRTRRLEGSALAKTCATMQLRYGVEFQFCTPKEAGERIIELLQGGGGHGEQQDDGCGD